MKTLIKILCLSVLWVSCEDEENALIGTWAYSETTLNENELDYTLVLTSSTCIYTFTVTSENGTQSCTHSGSWNSTDTEINLLIIDLSCTNPEAEDGPYDINATYVLSGDTLIITFDGDYGEWNNDDWSIPFTRQ